MHDQLIVMTVFMGRLIQLLTDKQIMTSLGNIYESVNWISPPPAFTENR